MLKKSLRSRISRLTHRLMRLLILDPRDRLRKTAATSFSKEIRGVPLRRFADNGFYVFRNFCEESEIFRLRSRYLCLDNLSSNDDNLGVPFFDHSFMDRFYESSAWQMFSMYGRSVYGLEPVLQIYPSLIVTKPTFKQEEFSSKNHRVPAGFHTDYPTELTVHVPLAEISIETSHTRYCARSHRSLRVREQRRYDSSDVVDRFEHVHLLANAGDMIAIDVTGIHRADVVRDSVRIMIQLKFTSPRYLLKGIDWSAAGTKARASRAFTENTAVFEEDLESSFLFNNARGINRDAVRSFLDNFGAKKQ